MRCGTVRVERSVEAGESGHRTRLTTAVKSGYSATFPRALRKSDRGERSASHPSTAKKRLTMDLLRRLHTLKLLSIQHIPLQLVKALFGVSDGVSFLRPAPFPHAHLLRRYESLRAFSIPSPQTGSDEISDTSRLLDEGAVLNTGVGKELAREASHLQETDSHDRGLAKEIL